MLAGFLRTLSLKWRAVIGVTVLTVAVLVAASAVQTHFMRQDFTRLFADQQFALVSRIAADLDTRFETYTELLVRSAAQFPAELLHDPAAMREYFRVRPALLTSFDDILVLSPDGRVLADYPEIPGRTTLSAAGSAWFTKALARKFLLYSRSTPCNTPRTRPS